MLLNFQLGIVLLKGPPRSPKIKKSTRSRNPPGAKFVSWFIVSVSEG